MAAELDLNGVISPFVLIKNSIVVACCTCCWLPQKSNGLL